MRVVVTISAPGWTREELIDLPAQLGRSAKCSLHIDRPGVSRTHAQLEWDEVQGAIWVRDLGSVNGLEIDGCRTVSGLWRPQQVLCIGDLTLVYVPSYLPATAPPARDEGSPGSTGAEGVQMPEAVTSADESWQQEVVAYVRDAMAQRPVSGDGFAAAVEALLAEAIVACSVPAAARAELVRCVRAELLGFGAIEELLRDEEIDEIMVNGAGAIWVERRGRLEAVAKRFRDEATLLAVIERMAAPLGRRIDEMSPMVDGRLPDGSRFHAVIPPVAIDGPALTVRKFRARKRTWKDLVALGSVSEEVAAWLRAAVRRRLNLVVSGGTGSGKTTLLNVLAGDIDPGERIVTIEDAAELRLDQPHVVRLETRPPNLEGRGAVSIRDLVRTSLRMRPDRIVVGECRGAEALDMLQAMNTGHDGSLTTVHANNPRDALARIETMALMADVALPHRVVREQAVRAIDAIVQTARLHDGSRRIVAVARVVGLEGEVPVLEEIARWSPNEGFVFDPAANSIFAQAYPEVEA